MSATKPPVCNFGEQAHDFHLIGTDNKHYTLEKCRGEKGTLIMFICNHCPFVKAIQKKLLRDATELLEYEVNSVAIMPNDTDVYPEDSLNKMQEVAAHFNFPFPYLYDANQTTARNYGALCTPDFFGYNRHLELQYRGRLDDSGMEHNPHAVRELFFAMQQIAQTDKGPENQKTSIGCSIKWKDLFN